LATNEQLRSPACPAHSRVTFRTPYFSLTKFFISLCEADVGVIASHHSAGDSLEFVYILTVFRRSWPMSQLGH
jgi:hypothetical protein